MTRASGRFWSNVMAVAYKETRILRHDRAFIGVIVAQPIMMLILQGAVLSNKPANVPWAVLDWSRSAVARRFVADVEATGYFLPPQPVASYDEGRHLLQQAEALAFVVIPETLARDVERGQPRVQLLLDGSDPLSAARVGGYIAQVGAALDLGTDTLQDRRPGVPVRSPGPIDIRQRFWFNPTLADRRFFLSALAGMLLTNLCLSVMSLALVGERESGTYEQMLALPTSSLEIVLGKVAPYVAVSYVLMFVSTAAAGVIFGVWPRGSWVTLSVATLPFVLASLAIGVFVSALARTSAQAVFIAVFFILPSFVLSGVIYPYQFMPRGVREIGGLFPLRWYQIALRRIIERGAGLVDVAGPMLALTLLFAVLLLAIRWRTKARLG
jgi:ABC-2 type transport system permease protein